MHLAGQTAYKALSEWFTSDGKRGTYIETPKQAPSCNPTCCSSLCYKCKLEKKSQPRNDLKVVKVRPKKQTPKEKRYYLYYLNSSWRLTGELSCFLSVEALKCDLISSDDYCHYSVLLMLYTL